MVEKERWRERQREQEDEKRTRDKMGRKKLTLSEGVGRERESSGMPRFTDCSNDGVLADTPSTELDTNNPGGNYCTRRVSMLPVQYTVCLRLERGSMKLVM